jgi:hypothetical protein
MIDMHMHSTASDGTFTPTQLVEEACRRGLKAMALTDHDTIDGLEEAIEVGKELGVEVVSGIEFSTEYQGKEIHILGYFLEINNQILIDKLEELRLDREERTKLMLKKLEKYKINISMEELMAEVEGKLISRTHIANAMMKKGYVYSRKEAFDVYLKSNGAAYVPKGKIDPYEAVRIINSSGGVASLAHPKLIGVDKGAFEELLKKLTKEGLRAIEVYYPGFTEVEERYYIQKADEHGLLYTGGSDFHGLNRPGIFVGTKGVNAYEFQKLKDKAME